SPLASAGNARPGGAGRGARGGRGYIPVREWRALPVRHRRGMGSRRGRRDADAAVVAAALLVSPRPRQPPDTAIPGFRGDSPARRGRPRRGGVVADAGSVEGGP